MVPTVKHRICIVICVSIGLHLSLLASRMYLDVSSETEATPMKIMEVNLISAAPDSTPPFSELPKAALPLQPKSKPSPLKYKSQIIKPIPIKEPKPQEEPSKNDAVTPLKALSEQGSSIDSSKLSTATGVTQRAEWKSAGLQNFPAKYPERARQMDWQGRVVLRVQVLPNGSAGIVNVAESSGHEILDDSALEAVKSWKFISAKRDGIPVESFVNVPINFKLKKEGD